jgi:hypothetical protein
MYFAVVDPRGITAVLERRFTVDGYNSDWKAWPVSWSAVWIGALAALAVGLVISLAGLALGAHEASRAVSWKNVRLTTLLFDIGGAFFAFVVGGWLAARIAGIYRSEPAMLHGAVVWLLTVPMLVIMASYGAVASFGGWYGGLAGAPAITAGATAAEALRNSALAAVVALLLGLVGSVLGGWMASGEPMSLTYYRRRQLVRGEADRPRRIA